MTNIIGSYLRALTTASALATAFLLPGCDPELSMENPSGDCKASDDGHRWCYSAGNDQYLPHCDPKLRREYWRTFAIDDDTAYVLPRPDEAGLIYGFCDHEDPEIRDLFERYAMCTTIDSATKAEVINSMTPADALTVTQILHAELRFTVISSGIDGSETWGITPYAPDEDVLDACAKVEQPATGFSAYCAEWQALYDEAQESGFCPDFAPLLASETVANSLAAALNDLYGIPSG